MPANGGGPKRIITLRRIVNELQKVTIAERRVEEYAIVDMHGVSAGRFSGKDDLWIAASARALNVPILTCDHDFDHLASAGPVKLELVTPPTP